jgi:hypothetical protein
MSLSTGAVGSGEFGVNGVVFFGSGKGERRERKQAPLALSPPRPPQLLVVSDSSASRA